MLNPVPPSSNNQVADVVVNPRINTVNSKKQSLLILGMKKRQEELLQLNNSTSGSSSKQQRTTTAERTLSFGWTEQLSQVYGSSCEAVFEVLSSIDAAVRGNFSSAREHYASVCSALEIRHAPPKRPANREIFASCEAHDLLNEAVMKWADDHAAENNIPKVTHVSSPPAADEEEQQQQQQPSTTTAVAVVGHDENTVFNKLAWECEVAANTSLTHQDTRTTHHAALVDQHNNRHLNERVHQSRRALLEVALSSPLETGNEEIIRLWNSADLTTLNLKQSALGERGFVSLLATLQMLPHISTLILEDAHLISPFIVALAVVCRPRFLPRLRILSLDGNPGGSMAVESLCELVRAHPLLTEVKIDRSFECLPSSRKRLQKSLDENMKRNETRKEKCKAKLEKEEKEEQERREKEERDNIENLNKNSSVLFDIESRARLVLTQLEDNEFASDILTSADREKLSLEMFLNQQAESEKERQQMEQKDKLWKESQEAERNSIETREQGRRQGVESDLDSLFTKISRDEEIKRSSIIRNAEARSQIGIELDKDSMKRSQLSEKLEASRAEYKKAHDERLDGDREVALARKHLLEKTVIQLLNSEEPGSRRALEKTEASTRDFMISGFERERIDRDRRQAAREEIERQASERLTQRRLNEEKEAEIRRRDEEAELKRVQEEILRSKRIEQEERERKQREEEEMERKRKQKEQQQELEAKKRAEEEANVAAAAAAVEKQEEKAENNMKSLMKNFVIKKKKIMDENKEKEEEKKPEPTDDKPTEDKVVAENASENKNEAEDSNKDSNSNCELERSNLETEETLARNDLNENEGQEIGGLRLLMKMSMKESATSANESSQQKEDEKSSDDEGFEKESANDEQSKHIIVEDEEKAQEESDKTIEQQDTNPTDAQEETVQKESDAVEEKKPDEEQDDANSSEQQKETEAASPSSIQHEEDDQQQDTSASSPQPARPDEQQQDDDHEVVEPAAAAPSVSAVVPSSSSRSNSSSNNINNNNNTAAIVNQKTVSASSSSSTESARGDQIVVPTLPNQDEVIDVPTGDETANVAAVPPPPPSNHDDNLDQQPSTSEPEPQQQQEEVIKAETTTTTTSAAVVEEKKEDAERKPDEQEAAATTADTAVNPEKEKSKSKSRSRSKSKSSSRKSSVKNNGGADDGFESSSTSSLDSDDIRGASTSSSDSDVSEL